MWATSTHLFARALWFGSEWGIQTDIVLVKNSFWLVENLISPPRDLRIDCESKEKPMLVRVLILDQLWKIRNLKLHEGVNMIVERIIENISSL
jgi:hypothetical protein